MALFSVSENLALKPCRAKYFFDPATGEKRLMSISQSSRPIFRLDGYELQKSSPSELVSDFDDLTDFPEEADSHEENCRRAVRRAKRMCFDLCACNAFDAFLTLTFNNEYVDRSDYNSTYAKIKNWLSNGVQRRGLMYVAVPEYHKDGENIHFHALCNSDALKLVSSGHKRRGKILYNLSDWKWGFTTAILIDGEEAHVKTAKYIMKYMGKNFGATIGGRYYLSGGKLQRPFFELADEPDSFGVDLDTCNYKREVSADWGDYTEWSFL